MATAAEIQTAYRAIYRVDLNATTAAAIASSGISLDAYIAGQLPQVASTTQAAVAIASFVTGTTPTSAKLDELKVAADAQVASYTAMKSSNPALGAYEAFGRSFATDATTTAAFNTKYGALSTTDFINVVYGTVYGTTPTAGAAANLTAQITYFTNLYTVNNVPNAALAAKGAVLGQIVGYAFTSDAAANSTLDNQVRSVLSSAASGDTTVYAKALPVAVDPGQVGVSITLVTGGTADAVSGTSANPASKSTPNNDTITGNFENADRIDAGAGDDTASLTLAAGANVVATGGLVSVENLKLTTGVAASSLDIDLATGVKSINVTDNGAVVTVSNIAAGVALSVVDTTPATAGFGATFALKDATGTADVANLSLNGVNTATVTLTGYEIANVTATGNNLTAVTLADAGLKTLSVTATKNAALILDATALETLTATGAGSVNVGTIAGTAIKSVDASGLTGTAGLTATIASGNALETFKLSGGADVIDLTTTGKALAVDLGAGNDTLTYTQTNAGVSSVFGAVVGGAGVDTITLTNAGSTTASFSTQKVTPGAGADVITLNDTPIGPATVSNVQTTIVYAAGDSTLTFLDTINNFKSALTAVAATSVADKIDLTAFAFVAPTIAYSSAVLPVADSAGLFGGNAIIAYRPGGAGADTTLLIDSNKDGNFTLGTDTAIKLAGVLNTDVTAANFTF